MILLILTIRQAVAVQQLYLNSIMILLILHLPQHHFHVLYNLNSIMILLIRVETELLGIEVVVFKFHYDSINS